MIGKCPGAGDGVAVGSGMTSRRSSPPQPAISSNSPASTQRMWALATIESRNDATAATVPRIVATRQSRTTLSAVGATSPLLGRGGFHLTATRALFVRPFGEGSPMDLKTVDH